LEVPPLFLNLAWNLIDPARIIGSSVPVLTNDGTNKNQGTGHKDPDGKYGDHGGNGDGVKRVIGKCNEVQNEGNGKASAREQGSSKNHGLDPVLASVPGIIASTTVASNERCECIADNEGSHNGTTL